MTLLRLLIFAVIFKFSEQCLRMQAGCRDGTTRVKKQQKCVQLINEKLTYDEAEGACIAMGGQLLNPPSSDSMIEVRKALAPAVKKAKAEDAWVGLVGNTDTGQVMSVNGTNVTFNYAFVPNVYLFHGMHIPGFEEMAAECYGTPDFSTCAGIVHLYQCYNGPVRKLSPSPGTDFRAIQQFMKALTYSVRTVREDKPCVEDIKRIWRLDSVPPFDLENPMIALNMNLLMGYMDGVEDTIFTWHKELLPAVCEYPLG